MGKVIAFHSTKGGVTKTTSTLSAGAKLAKKGYKVLVIDLDSQCNLTDVLVPDYQNIPIDRTIYATLSKKMPLQRFKTKIDNLHIVPASIILAGIDRELSLASGFREARLKEQLDKIKNDYDFVLLDCPPNLGWVATIAYVAADKLMIPVSPGRFEVGALDHLEAHIQSIRQEFNPTLEILGVFQTLSDSTLVSQDVYQYLKDRYGEKFVRNSIPRSTQIAKATLARQDIDTYDEENSPKKEPSKVNTAYGQLVSEMLLRS